MRVWVESSNSAPCVFGLNLRIQLLSFEVAAKRISGIKLKRRYPVLSHLLFADDSLIFLKAKKFEFDNFVRVLKMFT